MTATTTYATEVGEGQLQRHIDWRGAFWIASGVPALVLFSIGGIGGTVGNLAFLVWIVSAVMGVLQSFTYAEIAGLFPNKSGGASVYGATAWLRYSKFIAPLSVWCNWFAWTPVLSLGTSIAAAYILNAVAHIPTADSAEVQAWVASHASSITAGDPRVVAWLAEAANAGKSATDAMQVLLAQDAISALTPAIQTWTLGTVDLPGGVGMSFNSSFFIGAILMLAVFAVQHRGILSTANVQKYIGLLVIVPMFIVGVVPLLNGNVNYANFTPLVPMLPDGTWSTYGWAYILGAMFIAAWSTYGFETAICYTREFKDPKRDTFRAIFYSGLLCLVLFSLVPFTFQGVLGLNGNPAIGVPPMTDAGIVGGGGVAEAMARMVGGGPLLIRVLEMLMILALMLSIMTSMAGSSRTLYQGSADGWLPRYLSHVNEHGAPTRAMWTDLIFNLVLLAVAVRDTTSFFTILAISNCGYIIFNFLNLNSGWLHRIDSAHVERPFKAPTFIIAIGAIFAFVNVVFMGAGAKVYGNPYALWYGLIFAALIIPVFCFRHYVQDKGRFPSTMLSDLGVTQEQMNTRKAGMLPYLTLIAGVIVLLVANWIFQLPG
jgi:amino acid transporter